MHDFLQILLAIQRRQLQGVWSVQMLIEEVSQAITSGQEMDSARIAGLTQQLKANEVEIKAAVEAASKV